MSKTVIGAVSMVSYHDKERNLQRYCELIEEAAARNVKFLVFPEVSLQGYLPGPYAFGTPEMAEVVRYFRRTAEPVPGPATQVVAELARKHDMLIQIGMAESTVANVLYNSSVLIGPDGILGVFRKVHNQFEWPVFNNGTGFPVFNTPVGKVGMMICADLHYPETVRTLALHGAVIASMSTAWPIKDNVPAEWTEYYPQGVDHYGYAYDLLTRTNALTNQIWLISANQVRRGHPKTGYYFGHSRIVAPTGVVLAEVPAEEEGIAIAEVDIAGGLEHARTESYWGLNLLQDRKPEEYLAIARRTWEVEA